MALMTVVVGSATSEGISCGMTQFKHNLCPFSLDMGMKIGNMFKNVCSFSSGSDTFFYRRSLDMH
jgi:hypothetical protein